MLPPPSPSVLGVLPGGPPDVYCSRTHAYRDRRRLAVSEANPTSIDGKARVVRLVADGALMSRSPRRSVSEIHLLPRVTSEPTLTHGNDPTTFRVATIEIHRRALPPCNLGV